MTRAPSPIGTLSRSHTLGLTSPRKRPFALRRLHCWHTLASRLLPTLSHPTPFKLLHERMNMHTRPSASCCLAYPWLFARTDSSSLSVRLALSHSPSPSLAYLAHPLTLSPLASRRLTHLAVPVRLVPSLNPPSHAIVNACKRVYTHRQQVCVCMRAHLHTIIHPPCAISPNVRFIYIARTHTCGNRYAPIMGTGTGHCLGSRGLPVMNPNLAFWIAIIIIWCHSFDSRIVRLVLSLILHVRHFESTCIPVDPAHVCCNMLLPPALAHMFRRVPPGPLQL